MPCGALCGAWCGDLSAETRHGWAKEWSRGTNHWLNVSLLRVRCCMALQSVSLARVLQPLARIFERLAF